MPRPRNVLHRSRGSASAAFAVLLGASACAHPIEQALFESEGGAPGGAAAGGSVTAPAMDAPGAIGVALFTAQCTPGAPTVDWSPARRISRVEYDAMVRDLLGDTTRPANGFPPESPLTSGVNFEANTYAGVSTLIVQDYEQAAETLAATAVASAGTMGSIVPCQTQSVACATEFIETWGNRAFRGQLDATVEASLVQLFTDTQAQFDFATGIQAVIQAVLESPRFLYVLEFGEPSEGGKVVALAPYEVAARLALFLWRSVPDAALMTAAQNGQLATAAQVEAQAQRMLADPKAKSALDDFTTQWMQLQSTPTLGKDTQFATWTSHPKIGAEMVDETLTNFSQEVLGDGGLTDLLTSPASYINDDQASFYGMAPGNSPVTIGSGTAVPVDDPAVGATTTDFRKTMLPNRAGILTNGGVLATQSHTTLPSSVLRGKLVREQVLCDTIPPPPPGIPAPASNLGDAGTTRNLLEAHFNKQPCVSCHQYMDPIGLGFGFFDATGAYQPDDANGSTSPPDGGFPAIDATGQIVGMTSRELSASFDGATDLVTKLAGAAQTQECFALQEFRYALSRVEDDDDACSLQTVFQAFSSSGLTIQTLLVAITGSDAFRYRAATAPGSACQ